MGTTAITLQAMAEAAQDRADSRAIDARMALERAEDAGAVGNAQRHAIWSRNGAEYQREADLFEANAKLLRQLAINPDKSRKFVLGLIEEARR